MSLHVNARYVLLTYPQCGNLDGFAVMDRISTLGGECIVGREHHADGGLHLHVFCDFGRKFRSRKADVFDVDGKHPNVQPSRGTPKKGYNYAIKDGDVICGGLMLDDIVESRVGNGKTRDIWSQITSAPNRDAFWELCLELDPKSAATAFTQLSKFADWQYRVEEPDYSHPVGFEFIRGNVDGRDDWLLQSGIGSSEPQLGKLIVDSVSAQRLATFARVLAGVPGVSPRADGAEPPAKSRGFGALFCNLAGTITDVIRQTSISMPVWINKDWKDFVG